ncbi:MAG: hypothetical protein AB8H47_31365 [Bacteroidia bacterium]
MDNGLLLPPKTPEDRAELMEFYKTYLNSIEVTTNRRQQSNQFYIGLLTALLGIIGLIFKNDMFSPMLQSFLLMLGGMLGLMLCFLWRQYIISSVLLNTAKFKVLGEMEERLDERPFMAEYEWLNNNNYVGLGKIEEKLPWMMMVPYVIMIGFGFALLAAL